MMIFALLVCVCALGVLRYQRRYVGTHRAPKANVYTHAPVPAMGVCAPALPATPVYGTALHMLAQEGRAIEAARMSAPMPQEATMFNLARRTRSVLNRRLAAYLSAHGIAPEGEAWQRARRSHVCLFIGTEFIGDWDTLDDAHTALMGLHPDSRAEFDLCGDVRLPRNAAELELMRTLASDDDDRYWPTLTHAIEAVFANAGVDVSDAVVALETRAAERVVVQPVISSTERMRTLREAYKAAGLTTRGTVPLPTCGAPTKAATPCKRKAQDNGRCDWHQTHVSVSA
jgi:hypothetical protein